ncbi:MAG: hypothetical protein BZY88_04485 [SAR202 cluster bacterium Io17-Chloro-G9]|nr:MAG: hypothetical protein BZY88_04485 [SAR202 cluster bacterium Io17-Chloro-G9]
MIGGFALEAGWDVEPGEVQVLFGPSGAGKSTALRSIAGLLRPRRGHIEIGGRVVYDAAARVWVPTHRRQTGYVTQQYHLFPHLTVAGNIAYGLPRVARRGQAGRERVRELVQAVHLEGLEDRRTWELSGGQRQRVALGRALAPNPRLLLLDEPFASLDAELRRTLRRELRSMVAESPIPVLLVTHDREEALAMGDSIQVLDAGRPVAWGTPLEVLGQPGRGRVAALVGVENLFSLQVVSRNSQDGTMVCVGDNLRLEVPLDQPESETEAPQDDRVTVAIRASDIILAAEEPRGTSARNRIHGVVTSVEPRPPGYEVTLDSGRPLRCHITGTSLTEMAIRPGLPLWAVFKASSCFLVDES